MERKKLILFIRKTCPDCKDIIESLKTNENDFLEVIDADKALFNDIVQETVKEYKVNYVPALFNSETKELISSDPKEIIKEI